MNRRSIHAILVAAFVLVGCAPATPVEEDSTAAVEAINAAFAGYRDAALAGDVARVAEYMTDDAVMREPGMHMTKPEMIAYMTDMFSAGGGVASLDLRQSDLFVHGDAAYEIGEYDEVVRMAGGDVSIRGYYFLRWERGEDGAWRMDRVVAGPRDAPAAPTRGADSSGA